MEEFKRTVSSELISKLKEEPLFKEKLLEDIKKGDVFVAIRKDRIAYYYYNSKLFSYNNQFTTHSKFAFVPENYTKSYVADGEFIGEVADFYKGYDNIKERAKLYTSLEATGVSNICKKGNIFNNNDYIVLDIEIAFSDFNDTEPVSTIEQFEENRKQNRIDILLYGIKEQNLLFIEAKHYTNKEIRSNTIPNVVGQIERYNNEIKNHENEILSTYTQYIQNLNDLFGTKLPTPKSINTECGLIIFGFDKDQRDNYLKNSIEPKLKNIKKLYLKGDTKEINVENLYNA